MENVSAATNAKKQELRTYLSYSLPIDPARVITLTEMDMSYALGSTLVEMDDSKQIVGGLSSHWSMKGDRTYRFQLSEKAKWSDGSKITCTDIKKSFARAKQDHQADLRSLFDRIGSIECINEGQIDIHLKDAEKDGSFLKKLTEPMYGVVKTDASGHLDLGLSSGPFSLQSQSTLELILKKNPHWVHPAEELAESIIIKQPSREASLQGKLQDPWPNIIAAHSLMEEELSARIQAQGFHTWARNLDRTFWFIFMGKKQITEDERGLFLFLAQNLTRQTLMTNLMANLKGYTAGQEVFPRGYALYGETKQEQKGAATLPEIYKSRKLKILISPDRVSKKLQDNLSKAIEQATGKAPEYKEVPISEVSSTAKQGGFDFYAGSVGVADSNLDGALSYFLELNPTSIPSGAGELDFAGRLGRARSLDSEEKRIREFRAIMLDVTRNGYALPLFHFSTTVFARPEIDLSQIPVTDESVSFAKVRFSGK